MSTASVKLAKLYESLPPDAQRTLVEKHLLALLDSLPDETSANVVSAAEELHSRFRRMPALDLKGKKQEVNGLMDAISTDEKTSSITRERSNRDELLTEIVDSLTNWLNDVWSTAYEFHDNFWQAHVALVFTTDVAASLTDLHGPAGCKCFLMRLPIDITIKALDGTIVKTFSLRGPESLGKALLWIWREMFLSMLAYGTPATKKMIPEMLGDIVATMGWEALERLLYGGKSSVLSDYEDQDDDEVEDLDGIDCVDEDGDDDYIDEDDIEQMNNFCSSRAPHWPPELSAQHLPLRSLVESHLHSLFRTLPSLHMYNIIRAISSDPLKADRSLLQEILESATHSPDTFAGALEIYTAKSNAYRIFLLLNTHTHLLRPRDTPIYQRAVDVLVGTGYSAKGTQIIERELHEAIRAIKAALISIFGDLDREEHKRDVEEILKLRLKSQQRQDRIHQWTDAVLTQVAPMNPMAFAAMMMGFPMGGPVEDGGPEDPAGFLDNVDEADPDWDDLREEFRPKLKERFDGWYKLLSGCNKGLLSGVYGKAIQLMPFLRGTDIVEHMVVRLTELQGKTYIARALQSLSNFCIFQRKTTTTTVNKQRRAAEKASATAPFGATSASFPFSFQSQSSPQPSSGYGGMEDVD